jgi:hypothetical protein
MVLPVPSPRTFGVGEFEAGGYLNSVRDALLFLLNPPKAVLTQSTVQSLSSNVAAALTLDATTVDSYGGHSNTTNNSRYTAIVAGWYRVEPQGAWAASATGDRGIQVYKNGTAVATDWNVAPSSGATYAPGRKVGGLVFLNAGDYVEGWAIQNSGGALNTFSNSSVMSDLEIKWESS